MDDEDQDVKELVKHLDNYVEGDFATLATIGRDINGGMLHMVKHRGKQTCMAMKVHKKRAMMENPENFAKVHAELQTHKRLFYEDQMHSPFLMEMIGHFQTETKLFMVLTHVHGGDMFHHLKDRGRFDDDVAQFFAAEVVMGLETLHSKGLIYQNLKPENILITTTGHIKLTNFYFTEQLCTQKSTDESTTEDDLGDTKVVPEYAALHEEYSGPGYPGNGGAPSHRHYPAKSHSMVGTPEYAPPEVIKRLGHDQTVDLWALGVLVFEMLAGYSPFYDKSPFAIYNNVLHGIGKVEFPKDAFHPKAKEFIKECTATAPQRRMKLSKARKHPWLKKLDWDEMEHRSDITTGNLIPSVGGDYDVSCYTVIDKQYEDHRVIEHDQILEEEQNDPELGFHEWQHRWYSGNHSHGARQLGALDTLKLEHLPQVVQNTAGSRSSTVGPIVSATHKQDATHSKRRRRFFKRWRSRHNQR